MSYAYPLMLDVRDRPIVIVGGGRVAARKVAGLLAAGARRVSVVSPVFCDELPRAGVRLLAEQYRPEHLHEAQLVFAATDVREVNDAVVRDAHRRGVLVQRVDGEEDPAGDFTTPAVHRDGAVLIAVSTGGHPPLAAMIRDRLAEISDPIWSKMADALMDIRAELMDRYAPEQRRAMFRRAATAEALDVFRAGGREGLKEWLCQ